MSVNIVSNTQGGGGGFFNAYSVSIPATTAGNILIVMVTNQRMTFTTTPATSCEDNEANTAAYTCPAGFTNGFPFTGGFGFTTQLFYRANVPAGLTTITVRYPDTSNFALITVLEVSGINQISPLETANSRIGTEAQNTAVGNLTTTAFTDSLYVGACIDVIGNLQSATNGWTTMSPFGSGNKHRHAYKLSNGPETLTFTRGNSSPQQYVVSTAVFKSTPTSFTLNLNDTITTTDSDDNIASYLRSFSEGLSLVDLLNIINFSNNQFKSLNDALTTTDTISFLTNAARLYSESIMLDDAISFQQNFGSTFTDNIRLTEWMSIKLTNSTRWGN